MKKIIALGFLLVACSHSDKVAESPTLDTDTPQISDSMLAEAESDAPSSTAPTNSPETDAKLATTVAGDAPASTTTAAKDENPFANLSDTPKAEETSLEPKMNTSSSLVDSKTNTDSIPSNPTPSNNPDPLLDSEKSTVNAEATAPSSTTAEPEKQKQASLLLPKPNKRKTTAVLVEEFQQRAEENEKVQSEIDDRALIAHEGGNFQLGLDYARNAFSNYDFDNTAGKKFYDSQGALLSAMYFPLHSLTYGRLGAGGMVGGYLTKYITTNSSDQNLEVNKKLGFLSYGARITYEFQYWLGQILVPHVFIGYEQVRVSAYQLAAANINYPSNTFSSQVYGGGINLNLNRLEPKAAGSALANVGVKKFYLAYTYYQRSDSTETGGSHLLGLRFEY